MKLLTVLKRASKKAEQSHGAIECFVKRKYGLDNPHNNDWIKVDLYGIQIDAQLEMEDLLADDWILEEEAT